MKKRTAKEILAAPEPSAYSEMFSKALFLHQGMNKPEWVAELLSELRKKGVRDTGKDFNYDLAVGKEGERLVDELLTGNKTVEVKLDERAFDTGNIAVEVAHTYGKSGLSVTESEWYAFVLGGGYRSDIIFFIKTDRLKKLVERWGRDNAKAGKNGRSKFKLLYVTDLLADPEQDYTQEAEVCQDCLATNGHSFGCSYYGWEGQ